jgi:hypothetical protein
MRDWPGIHVLQGKHGGDEDEKNVAQKAVSRNFIFFKAETHPFKRNKRPRHGINARLSVMLTAPVRQCKADCVSLGIIQTVSPPQVVRDGKADVVADRFGSAGRLVSRCTVRPKLGGAPADPEQIVSVLRVEVISHHDSRGPRCLGQILGVCTDGCGCAFSVGRTRHKIHRAGQGDAAHKVGHKMKVPRSTLTSMAPAGIVG